MIETHYHLPGCPCVLALLTDTHDGDPEPVLRSLAARAPAVILHAGDFVHGRKPRHSNLKMEESQNAVALFRGCARQAPTFVSLGNHEACLTEQDLALIRSTGVELLNNSFTRLPVGSGNLVIGGLSSGYYTSYQNKKPFTPSPPPETDWLEDFSLREGYHILLMHHPEYYSLIPTSVECVVAGHAHGGQWRFYDLLHRKWRGVYAPDQGLFPALTAGVTENRLVISRGLRNTANLPRFFNPTEIIYIEG